MRNPKAKHQGAQAMRPGRSAKTARRKIALENMESRLPEDGGTTREQNEIATLKKRIGSF